MKYMFAGCISLTSIDVSHFNTSNVTNMANMFVNCSELTSVNMNNLNIKNQKWLLIF